MATLPHQALTPAVAAIAERDSIEDVVAKLATSTESGLTQAEAARRLAQYGPNALKKKRTSPIMRLLSYFWGPIPWTIETAAASQRCARSCHGRF